MKIDELEGHIRDTMDFLKSEIDEKDEKIEQLEDTIRQAIRILESML